VLRSIDVSFALLARVLVMLQAAPAPEETVIWFGPTTPGLDGRALLEAVAVYTRDLHIAVRPVAQPPPPSNAAGVAAAAATVRARGARLGFWCEPQPDRRTVALTTVDRAGHTETHAVDAQVAAPELYRGIALKLRSALAATVGGEAPPPARAAAPASRPRAPAAPVAARVPPPAPAPVATVEPIPTAGTAAPPTFAPPSTPPPAAAPASAVAPLAPATSPPPPAATPAPAPAAPAVATVRSTAGVASAPARGPSRFFLALDYRLSAATGAAPLRQAISLEANLALPAWIELAAGAELAPRATEAAGAGSVSVFDLPVSAGARLVARRARWTAGAGAFGVLHLLWATAAPAGGGAGESSRALAAGGGVELLGRARLAGRTAAEVRLFAEAAVPSTTYWVGGTPVLDVGSRLGAAVGLVFPAP
jgi:hypothetical protein